MNRRDLRRFVRTLSVNNPDATQYELLAMAAPHTADYFDADTVLATVGSYNCAWEGLPGRVTPLGSGKTSRQRTNSQGSQGVEGVAGGVGLRGDPHPYPPLRAGCIEQGALGGEQR